MSTKTKSPTDLSQTSDLWFCAVRRLRGWIRETKGEKYFRPFILAVVHMNSGMLLALEPLVEYPTPQDLMKKLSTLMVRPGKKTGLKPHRPAEIHFEEKTLVDALTPSLAEVRVQALYKPQRKNMDGLVKSMEDNLWTEGSEILGLLKKKGVTPAQVGLLYEAATAFYRAEPWVQLSNEDVLAVQVQPQKEPYYVIVMGQSGQEYGLSISRSWQEVESLFTAQFPFEILPKEGRHAFLFSEPPFVSIDDVEAVEKYGWELSEADLYPMPIIYTQDQMQRPDAKMLRWYEAVLRAIPPFVAHHLQTNPDGTHLPAEAYLAVHTSAGEVNVHIRYPAGDLSHIEKIRIRPSDLEVEVAETERMAVSFDRRSIERELDMITKEIGDESSISRTDLQKAQEIMYDAWEETNPTQRIRLARKALKTCPDCADAYVLLAEESAKTARQALELFQNGVAAGRRALGEAFFRDLENVGHFWGMLETRPFMRALQGLANTQWDLDMRLEAEANYRELLRLNPNDNQGIRYQLLNLLLELGRDEHARWLLTEYKGDWSADWAYTQALLDFRSRGESPQANRALRQALKVNTHVPNYLTGMKRIPLEEPDFITMGGEDEAIAYASAHLNHWRKTPGAIDWLRKKTPTASPGSTQQKLA